MWVRSLGWEDPLEEKVATHTSILTWKIPWTEEPVGLQSMGLKIVKHDWVTEDTSTSICCVNQSINGRLFFMALILSKGNNDAFLTLVVQVILSTASLLGGPHHLTFDCWDSTSYQPTVFNKQLWRPPTSEGSPWSASHLTSDEGCVPHPSENDRGRGDSHWHLLGRKLFSNLHFLSWHFHPL